MINPALLDPWDDASLLAQRLQQSNTRLLILIGAEQWCAKCRELRPQFDDLVAQAKPEEVWLWLDLEDHAEFIGDYLPGSLPMLIVYQGEALLYCQVIEDAQQALADQIKHIRTLLPRTATPSTPDPGIRARLAMQDWASE